jgi:hypothetical protein
VRKKCAAKVSKTQQEVRTVVAKGGQRVANFSVVNISATKPHQSATGIRAG